MTGRDGVFDVLAEARLKVDAGAKQYGGQLDGFARTAKMWSALFGIPISAQQVVLAFALNKISRQASMPNGDNLIDLAGYAQCANDVVVEGEARVTFRRLAVTTMSESDLASAILHGSAFERDVARDILAQRAIGRRELGREPDDNLGEDGRMPE